MKLSMQHKRRWQVVGSATAILIVALLLLARPFAWMAVLRAVRGKFPSVAQLSTADLAAWLNDSHRPPPVLLDVRTPAEYAVSHLPGARLIDGDADPAAQLPDVPKDAPIVAYCSVGYRSSAFVEKLRQAGFTHAQNLEGSLFRWANEGRPLADGKKRVHPYNAYWGWLLRQRS